MKKLKIFFTILLIILLLGLGYQVYAKYVMTKNIEVAYNTSDYYFDVSTDATEIPSFPYTINVTVKNNNGTNFTDDDLKYILGIDDENYSISIADGTTRTLTGGSMQEETFPVTIIKENINTAENIELKFNINNPYKETKTIDLPITEGLEVLADVVSVGDFVNYDANSNGTYAFTSNDCLAGTSISTTISSENKFNTNAPAQWRVLSVNKEAGTVELMSAEPTQQSLTVVGLNGFLNAETVLNNIGAIYGHGKGASGGRSITIEDIDQYSNYDKTKFGYGNYLYGNTRTYNSGIFFEEIKDSEGNVIGYGTTPILPATLTLTYYAYEATNYFTDTNAYNTIFKNSTNSSYFKPIFWLASRCSGLYDNYGTFMLRRAGEGWTSGHQVFDSSNYGYTRTEYVSIVVPLENKIKTTGQDENGVWQLKVK